MIALRFLPARYRVVPRLVCLHLLSAACVTYKTQIAREAQRHQRSVALSLVKGVRSVITLTGILLVMQILLAGVQIIVAFRQLTGRV